MTKAKLKRKDRRTFVKGVVHTRYTLSEFGTTHYGITELRDRAVLHLGLKARKYYFERTFY